MPDHVLIAEDETFLREMMISELQEHGVQTKSVMNGEDALTDITEDQPKLLLLDLLMPKKDGYAVLREIRQKGYTFPVIVMTNLSDPVEQEKCLALGARDVIIKSNISSDELWDKVKHCLPST